MRKDIEKFLKNCTEFQRKVYLATMSIPKGQTRSYKWIACQIGSPQAYRAVGNVLHKNPFGIVIPCHRVIKSDGHIGGFSKGLHNKRKLLREEGIFIRL